MWFPVILAIASVLFALYIVLWAIIISFFGVELGFVLCYGILLSDLQSFQLKWLKLFSRELKNYLF